MSLRSSGLVPIINSISARNRVIGCLSFSRFNGKVFLPQYVLGERDGHFVSRASAAAAAVVGESRFEDKYKLNANPTEDELDEKKKRKDEWKKKKAEKREKRMRKRKGKCVRSTKKGIEEARLICVFPG